MRGIGHLKTRAGRCYELAGRLTLANADRPGLVLAHGRVRGRDGSRVDHAWVEVGDAVYDRTRRDVPYPRAAYRRIMDAADVQTFTPREGAEQLSAHGHWGPWE